MEWWILGLSVSIALMVLSAHLNTRSRIARIEHKVNLLLKANGIEVVKGLPLSDRVKEIARDPARKIEAIKTYREETGAGLADAKEAVEAHINSL